MPYSRVSFQMTLCVLVIYSMTWSIVRSLWDSWASWSTISTYNTWRQINCIIMKNTKFSLTDELVYNHNLRSNDEKYAGLLTDSETSVVEQWHDQHEKHSELEDDIVCTVLVWSQHSTVQCLGCLQIPEHVSCDFCCSSFSTRCLITSSQSKPCLNNSEYKVYNT